MNNLPCSRQAPERQGILSNENIGKSTTSILTKAKLLLVALLLFPMGSWAQSSEPSELSERLDNNRDSPQLTQGKPIFNGLGKKLGTIGITPHLSLWSLWVSNPSTGPRENEYAITNNIFAGADLNLEKLLGISNATFHFEYIFFLITTMLASLLEPFMREPLVVILGARRRAMISLAAICLSSLTSRIILIIG
ncbi:hypothetical protein [Halomonas sp. WWR20]